MTKLTTLQKQTCAQVITWAAKAFDRWAIVTEEYDDGPGRYSSSTYLIFKNDEGKAIISVTLTKGTGSMGWILAPGHVVDFDRESMDTPSNLGCTAILEELVTKLQRNAELKVIDNAIERVSNMVPR